MVPANQIEKRGLNILVVEDDDDDYLLFEEQVHKKLESQYRIKLYRIQSIAFFNDPSIPFETLHLVVLDLNLPGSTGIDTFLEFKKQHPFMPVLILSHYDESDQVEKAAKLGAVDFISKRDLRKSNLRKIVQFALEREHLIFELIKDSSDGTVFLDIQDYSVLYLNNAAKKIFPEMKNNSSFDWPFRIGKTIVHCEKPKNFSKSQIFEISARKLFLNAMDIISIKIENITYQVELRQNLRMAKEKADYANHLKSKFIANVSHELRTPLNAIIATCDLLNDTQLDEAQAKYNQILTTSSKHLLNIINDLLDFSKLEAGKDILYKTNFDLKELLDSTCKIFQPLIEQKKLDFKTHFTWKNSVIYSDASKIRHIIQNLLSNAIKYTDRGCIYFSSKIQDDSLHIEIEDTGIGMEKNELNTIFKSFTRLGPTSNIKGTGLGLAITQALVKILGGKVFVHSEPQKGSRFLVQIPVAFGAHISKPIARKNKDSQKIKKLVATMQEQKSKALIVDDDPLNLKILGLLLTSYSIPFHGVESGQEAIDYVRKKNSVQFIFMDYLMPGLNGCETTERLRKLGFQKPIISLTAEAQRSSWEKQLKSGMNDQVLKPIDKKKIGECLSALATGI